jgi:hypothetical protein
MRQQCEIRLQNNISFILPHLWEPGMEVCAKPSVDTIHVWNKGNEMEIPVCAYHYDLWNP